MKTSYAKCRTDRSGYALLLVMVFLGLILLILAGVLNWTAESSRLTDRNNEYYTSSAAAEAATEKVLVRISRDYLRGGEAATFKNLASYRTNVPTAGDNAYWGNYAFSNPQDGSASTYVSRISPSAYAVLDGQYKGLSGNRAIYRISSDAIYTPSRYGNIVAGIRQDVAVESIPLFQFAIFYTLDLEINPSPAMVVTGRVHSNGDIFTLPSTSLVFSNDVTASGTNYATYKPGDPQGNRGITNTPNVTFLGEHDSGTSTLNLPIGTNNTPDNVFEVLKIPPAGEDPASPMGTNRFYNKADVIITVTDNNVTVTSGVQADNQATSVPQSQWKNFMDTNVTFVNKRENITVQATQIDVGKFRTWAQSSTNPLTAKLVGKSTPNIVYVDDMRSPVRKNGSSTTPVEPGIKLVNGAQLPNGGLTITTPDPIYVQGNYNTTADGVHTSAGVNDTANTLPAAIIGDAITILSTGWSDANSGNKLTTGTRNASDTTVNAAFLGGIVPTGGGSYSGGVENFPRFLEDWSSSKFWYNGSMVVMFDSRTAKAPWGGGDVYSPPKRNWAFDKNFYDNTKLPPGTPQILFLERMNWSMQTAGIP
jgi:hypothetical protein